MKSELLRIGAVGLLLLSDRLAGVTADHNAVGENQGDSPVLPHGHHQPSHHKSDPDLINKPGAGVLFAFTNRDQNKGIHKEPDPDQNDGLKALRTTKKHTMDRYLTNHQHNLFQVQ